MTCTESAFLNQESSDSESCAIPRSRYTFLGCDSDGDSESIFRDSTLLRFDSVFLLLPAEFLAIPARDSGNRAIRDSRFCATKLRNQERGGFSKGGFPQHFLVAQSNATGVTLAVTPPCSAICFRNPIVPRYPAPARCNTPPWPPASE